MTLDIAKLKAESLMAVKMPGSSPLIGVVLELIAALEAKDAQIAELEQVKAAAEKLVRCKGRYHSEQNYRALAALFGVKTPDLPLLPGESGINPETGRE